MKIYSIHFLIILNIIFSAELIPPSLDANWNILQDSPVWVGWLDDGQFQWCRASSTISASIEEVQNIIEDKKNYPNVFKRIDEIQILTDEIVYIALDMPFPFSGRDYVVKYIQEHELDDFIYRFYAVNHPDVPSKSKYVRLVHSAGEWRLKSLDSNFTEISYTWNGELLGDFPDWALTRAWKQQGLEVINWLQEAVDK